MALTITAAQARTLALANQSNSVTVTLLQSAIMTRAALGATYGTFDTKQVRLYPAEEAQFVTAGFIITWNTQEKMYDISW